mmetsp:Transcript_1396/g.3113  ORF Transcript_1396/g.3113 Transcript_1396/m.3113 type:complete len:231 (-) Transcript_1396:477-1169(-)
MEEVEDEGRSADGDEASEEAGGASREEGYERCLVGSHFEFFSFIVRSSSSSSIIIGLFCGSNIVRLDSSITAIDIILLCCRTTITTTTTLRLLLLLVPIHRKSRFAPRFENAAGGGSRRQSLLVFGCKVVHVLDRRDEDFRSELDALGSEIRDAGLAFGAVQCGYPAPAGDWSFYVIFAIVVVVVVVVVVFFVVVVVVVDDAPLLPALADDVIVRSSNKPAFANTCKSTA